MVYLVLHTVVIQGVCGHMWPHMRSQTLVEVQNATAPTQVSTPTLAFGVSDASMNAKACVH